MKNNPQVIYEPEADVLSWELNDQPIDHAQEIGNLVVHFSKDNSPVLVEILQARDFINKTRQMVSQSV